MRIPDRMTWLGQAGFLFESAKIRFVVDMFLTPTKGARPPVTTPEELGKVDVALATHEHLDHLDKPSLGKLAKACPELRLVVPEPVFPQALDIGMGEDHVIAARAGQPLTFGDVTVTPVLSAHGVHVGDGYGLGDPPGRFLGYVVKMPSVTLYHSGDTVVYPGMIKTLSRMAVDIALLPINGRTAFRECLDIVGNLSAEEAVEVAGRMGAKCLVPMHYDAFEQNSGDPGLAVDLAHRRFPALTVLVPGYGQPIVVGC